MAICGVPGLRNARRALGGRLVCPTIGTDIYSGDVLRFAFNDTSPQTRGHGKTSKKVAAVDLTTETPLKPQPCWDVLVVGFMNIRASTDGDVGHLAADDTYVVSSTSD